MSFVNSILIQLGWRPLPREEIIIDLVRNIYCNVNNYLYFYNMVQYLHYGNRTFYPLCVKTRYLILECNTMKINLYKKEYEKIHLIISNDAVCLFNGILFCLDHKITFEKAKMIFNTQNKNRIFNKLMTGKYSKFHTNIT